MIFFRKRLNSEIDKATLSRPFFRIIKIDNYGYHLTGEDNKTITLHISFVDLKPKPSVGDGLYLSENIIDGIKINYPCYTFSTHIGKKYARPPHDFYKNPRGFLIFEYANKKRVLLEQWYG
ncbi:MAG: hypothetical protein IJ039_08895 [Clostridia bacterium]|nr:hypothetical protein [Clostridia bacterium]